MFQLPSNQFFCATMGLPGSGKSTWAASIAYAQAVQLVPVNVVNRDDIRRALNGDEYPKKFVGKFEKKVARIRDERIRAALSRGHSVICSDTNLNLKTMDGHRRLVAEFPGVEFCVNDDFLFVPVEECIRRDVHRTEGRCGKDVIERMYYEYMALQPKPPNEGPWTAIICDLDGTLCHLPPGMTYPAAFDRDYRGDVVNPAVKAAVKAAANDMAHVLLVSGRFAERLGETREWLATNDIRYDALFTRPVGDRRPDTVVKRDLYMDHIQGKYRVLYVLDDRPSVVRMWRAELGLPVFQVAPNLEF